MANVTLKNITGLHVETHLPSGETIHVEPNAVLELPEVLATWLVGFLSWRDKFVVVIDKVAPDPVEELSDEVKPKRTRKVTK